VAIADVNRVAAEGTAEEFSASGFEAVAISADVTVEHDVQVAVRTVVERWGAIDILVNNAGIAIAEPAEITSLANFRKVMEIDLIGALAFCQAAFVPMREANRGSIINIASMAGLAVLRPQKHVGYNVAKSGIIMLTKTLAVEWAQFGIRVNAIAPGYTLSPAVVALRDSLPADWSEWMRTVPMSRAAETHEMQGAAIYLAGDASSYVTGSVLCVDGGYTCI
jgi:NAD(P)-dependent dehydrogenase (short-subunit alcohol dehydrogenase family)